MTNKSCENCKFYDEDVDNQPCCSCVNKENFEADNNVGDKMQSKDIIKALECCIKSSHLGECFENKCPLVSEKGCKVGKETLYPYALKLIKNQQAYIKKYENIERASDKLIELQKAEIDKLKAELDCYKNWYFKAVEDLKTTENVIKNIFINNAGFDIDIFAEVKTEAYKEFADRLCEDRVPNDNTVILAKCLLKELTERKEDEK